MRVVFRAQMLGQSLAAWAYTQNEKIHKTIKKQKYVNVFVPFAVILFKFCFLKKKKKENSPIDKIKEL